MSKTTFLGYVPSLKAKHEATIVEGKAIESKGGSIRYTLRGEYEGRKTLPKTVSKADFESVYGFDAKEAEAVIMTGELEGQKGKVNIFNKVGEKDGYGFKPETIIPVENEDDLTEAFMENAVAPDGTKIKDLKEADTVGSPSPASVEPPAPSEKPFPQEPSNENFSAEMIECGNCDETFTIDEGLDIGGIDYCEECYDTLSAKEESDENFSAPLFQRKYTPQKLTKISTQGKDEEVLRKLFIKTAKKKGFEFSDIWPSRRGKTLEEIVGTDEYNGMDYQTMVYWMMEMQEKGSALKWWKELGWDSKAHMEKWQNGAEIQEAFSADYYCTKCDEGFDSITPTDEGQFCNSCLPDSATAHDDMDATTQREDFNAFGFGKDEEEESEEPKTQEFTVVLQEGDKLELTDIEEETEEDVPEEMEPKEEDNDSNEENDEKEAEEGTRTFVVSSVDYETDDEDQDELDLPQDFTITLDGSDMKHLEQMEKEYNEEYPGEWPDYEMQEIADLMVDTISDESGWLVEGFYFEELMPDGTLKSFNAVQAKITRPVKEEEDEEKEEEGMSTLMKVGLGVGALAVGAAILGAEERVAVMWEGKDDNNDGLIYGIEYYGEDGEFSDVEWFRTAAEREAMLLDSDGESDYWAGENAEWRAETISKEMTYNIDIDSIIENEDELLERGYSERDIEAMRDEVLDKYKDGNEVLEEISTHHLDVAINDRMDNDDDEVYLKYGDKMVDDVESAIEYDVDVGGWNAETFEARTTRKSIHNPITDESQYDNPTGKMLITPDGKGFSGRYERDKRKRKGHKRVSNPKKMDWDNANSSQDFIQTKQREKEDLRNIKRHGMADTVGSPSPSGPSSIPEPAEATGSEPSNEQFSAVVDKEFYENVSGSLCPNCGRDGDLGHFSTLYWCDDCGNEGCDGCTDDCDCNSMEAESKNLKMALGITALGIGLAAVLGKDKLTKLFDRFNL